MTQPPPPLPRTQADTGATTASPRRRRRRWPVIVSFVVVLTLLVGGWFAGEYLARETVTGVIRSQVIKQLSLPADHPMQIDLEGSVLTQLIVGELDEVRISSKAVPLGSITADVELAARGVPVRDSASPMDAAAATITLDQASLQQVVAAAPGVPNGTVTINAPEVALTTSINVLGFPLELGVGLVPTAGEGEQVGDLVLTPNSVRAGGATLTAAQVREQFGGAADAVLAPIDLCIANWIPVGATITGVVVRGAGPVGELVVAISIDGRILSDPALQSYGSCERAG